MKKKGIPNRGNTAPYLFAAFLFIIIPISTALSVYYAYIEPQSSISYTFFHSQGYRISAVMYFPSHGPDGAADTPRPMAVVVHGYGMSKEMMLSPVIELARRGFAVIAFDLPGHGFSDSPYKFTNISPYIVSDALNFLEQNAAIPLNSDFIVAVGHSMGAMTVIKAGALDSRIDCVVAMAAPSESGPILNYNPMFNMYLCEVPVENYVNTTNPPNLLYILGENDELVTPLDALTVMSAATGLPADRIKTDGTIYGNFKNGTARSLIFFPFMDHATEAYDPRSLSSMLDWIAKSAGIPPEDFETEDITSLYRACAALVAVFCSFISAIPLSFIFRGILREYGYKNPSAVDIANPYALPHSLFGKGNNVRSGSEKGSDYEEPPFILKNKRLRKKTALYTSAIFLMGFGLIPGVFLNSIHPFFSVGGTIFGPYFASSMLWGWIFGSAVFISVILTLRKLSGNKEIGELSRIFSYGIELISERNSESGGFFRTFAVLFIYASAVFIIPAILTITVCTVTLFNIVPNLYRIGPLLATVPFTVLYTVTAEIMIRPMFASIFPFRMKFSDKVGLPRFLLIPLCSALLKSAALGLLLGIGVGTPFLVGIAPNVGFWMMLTFGIFIIMEYLHTIWIDAASGSCIPGALLQAFIIAITVNVAFAVS